MLLGGMSHFAGPIIGVIVLVAIAEPFRSLKEFAPFIFGGMMLLVIFLMTGLFPSLGQWLRRTFGKKGVERWRPCSR
jgi:ABC-type branched-subunit amino acid transport system permease subunit